MIFRFPARLVLLLLLAQFLLPCVAQAVTDQEEKKNDDDKLVVAILEFDAVNEEAKQGNKGRIISEIFTTAAVKNGLEVVERHMIRKVMDEMEFGESSFSGTDAMKIGVMLGAKAVLTGSVSEFLGALRIDARLINVTDGKILLADGAQAELNLQSITTAVQGLMAKMVRVLEPGQAPQQPVQQAQQPAPAMSPQPAPQPIQQPATTPAPASNGIGGGAIANSTGQPSQQQTPPQAGQIWTEPTTGLVFAFLPGGCYTMGSPTNESGRDKDERQHQVCLDPFWMGLHEVPRKAFAHFVSQTGYVTDAEREGFSWIYLGKTSRAKGHNWRNVRFQQSDSDPVVNVSWNDAQAFVRWLSSTTGYRFRLPSEEEWEYACRAGTNGRWYWGENSHNACQYANVHDATSRRMNGYDWNGFDCDDGFAQTAPVGSKMPNPFGLFDMLGNVWEWTQNPDPASGKYIARGGSWDDHFKYVRCANRDLIRPHYRIYSLGFRVVLVQ